GRPRRRPHAAPDGARAPRAAPREPARAAGAPHDGLRLGRDGRGSPSARSRGLPPQAGRPADRAREAEDRARARGAPPQRRRPRARGARPSADARPPFPDHTPGGPGMRRVVDLIAQVSPTVSTLLLTGESGTGKEVVARAIHRASPRAAEPFVAVNLGALPDT